MQKIRVLGLSLIFASLLIFFLKPIGSLTGFAVAENIVSNFGSWIYLFSLGIFLVGVNLIYQAPEVVTITDYQKRKAAIKRAREIGAVMAREHPEIADLYRGGGDFERYIDIAREYMGKEAEEFPQVCGKAIGYAVRELMSPAERSKIKASRNTKRLEKMFGGFDSEEFRKHCVRARQIKEKRGIKTPINSLIKGRGQTPWYSEEQKEAIRLINEPEYQLTESKHRGKPNYEMIAERLNVNYHNSNKIRSKSSVGNYVRDLRRQKKIN